ncbi:MAG: hypothetical protein ACTSSE_17415 [Candidatus Thorarchaeota archaeon]
MWKSIDLPEIPRVIPIVDTEFKPLIDRMKGRESYFDKPIAKWFMEYGHVVLDLFHRIEQEKKRAGKKRKDYVAIRIQRALKLYEEALIKEPIECVLFAVIGIESLYSMGSGELRLGISQRASVMLGQILSQSIVYDDVHTTYKIRSEFVHGKDAEKGDTEYLL